MVTKNGIQTYFIKFMIFGMGRMQRDTRGKRWVWYGVLNPYIVIDDHSYDGNHVNGIIDLSGKEIGVRQLFV